MEKRLKQIETKIDKILELLQTGQFKGVEGGDSDGDELKDPREVKMEGLYSLEHDKLIESCLIGKSIGTDLKLIKKYYFPLDRVSITKCGSNSVKYWLGGKWNKDILGEYTKTVLCKNLISCYLKVNSFERYENNMDNFIENQAHIKKLGTPKYQTNLMGAVMKLL
jgi:hypothetical protein